MKLKLIIKIIFKHLSYGLLSLRGRKSKIIPYKALLVLTNDCNSKCNFCGIWKINQENPDLKKGELQSNDYLKFFKSYNKDLLWLALGGGEVTLVKDIFELIDVATYNCPNLGLITFTTNGLKPSKAKEIAKYIKSKNLSCFVTISLDGDKRTHDELRGVDGNFEKAHETIKLVKSIGVRAYFGITLSDKNAEFIKNNYHEYSRDMKAVTFVHSHGIYYQENKQDLKKIQESFDKVIKEFKVWRPTELIEYIYLIIGRKFVSNKMKKNLIPCNAGYSSIHVSPSGNISPCMFLPASGNIKTGAFKEIILSEKNQKIRQRAPIGDCQKCWMNCYAPHSIIQHPIKSLRVILSKN